MKLLGDGRSATPGLPPTGDKIIAVTGCGRSGTKYISQFWTVLGFAVGHEIWKKDGIASWIIPFENEWKQFQQNTAGKEVFFFHQTRAPLKVISSLISRRKFQKTMRGMIHTSNKESRLLQCAKYWYYWNKIVEDKLPIRLRYQVDELPHNEQLVKQMANIVGVSYDPDVQKRINRISTTANSRPSSHRRGYSRLITWEDIEQESREIHDLIRRLASRYGYKE